MGKKINQLPAAPVLLSTDLCIVGNPIDGAMYKVSLKQLRDYLKMLFDPLTADITKVSDVYAFGDDFMLAANISPVRDTYINRFSTEYNKKLNLFAEKGRGVWQMINKAYEKIPQVSSNVLTLAMAGLNDIRLAGTNAKTLEKIKHSYRSLIANQFLKTAVPFSDASVTKTGVWKVSNYPSSTVGGKAERLGGKGIASVDIGDKAVVEFTGTNVVIGYIGSDGSAMHTQGAFKVYIDDVLRGTYQQNDLSDGVNDGSYDNILAPACLVFTGLSSGKHTLTVETTATDSTVFDYVGTLQYPEDCSPILIGQIPMMTAVGYKADSPYDKATEAGIAQANAAIVSVVREFTTAGAYPVVMVPINKAIQLPADIDKDNVHWNSDGHLHVFNAMQVVVR